jgi:hypothetical protein
MGHDTVLAIQARRASAFFFWLDFRVIAERVLRGASCARESEEQEKV